MTEPAEQVVVEESKEADEEAARIEAEEKERTEAEEKAKEEEEKVDTAQENEEEKKEEQKEVDQYDQIFKAIDELAGVDRKSVFDIECGSHMDFVPQLRMLMQLEQLIGIAEKSPLVNSLLQNSLHPSKIQNLIELAAQAHP